MSLLLSRSPTHYENLAIRLLPTFKPIFHTDLIYRLARTSLRLSSPSILPWPTGTSIYVSTRSQAYSRVAQLTYSTHYSAIELI